MGITELTFLQLPFHLAEQCQRGVTSLALSRLHRYGKWQPPDLFLSETGHPPFRSHGMGLPVILAPWIRGGPDPLVNMSSLGGRASSTLWYRLTSWRTEGSDRSGWWPLA